MDTNERLSEVEKTLIKVELTMESMAESLGLLTSILGTYKVIEAKTYDNGIAINRIESQLVKIEEHTSKQCDSVTKKIDKNSDEAKNDGSDRLKFGLTTSIGVTFAVASLLIGVAIIAVSMYGAMFDRMSIEVSETHDAVILNGTTAASNAEHITTIEDIIATKAHEHPKPDLK